MYHQIIKILPILQAWFIGLIISMEDPSYLLQRHALELERVFVYYCSFGDKENYCLLRIQNFSKLISDLQLLHTPPPHPLLDIIFTTHATAHALHYTQYTHALVQVALETVTHVAEDKRVGTMLAVNLRALHDYILHETDFGSCLQTVSLTLFTQISYVFLREFQQGMTSIYSHYFPREHSNQLEEELKGYFRMGRELGIVPKVMSKPVSYLLFLQLRNRQATTPFKQVFSGQTLKSSYHHKFDVICLADWLIWASHLNNRSEVPAPHKIYQLLEQLQLSQGYKAIGKISKVQHFFLTPAQLHKLSQPKSPPTPSSPLSPNRKQHKAVESPTKSKLGQYHDSLRNKFTQLCTKKTVETNFYMEPSRAKRMLRELCPTLSGSALESMINNAGRLNFDNFVGLISRVAERVSVEPERLYVEVANYGLNEPNHSVPLQRMMLTESEQVTCGEILSQVRPYLRTMYEFFEFNGGVSCSGFLNLLEETTLIPGLLSQIQANDIYHFCAKKQEKMTLDEFQGSLLRIVVALPFPCDLEGPQRLVHLLQVMSGSRRGESLMKKNALMVREHPLYRLRISYPHIYKAIEMKLPPVSSLSSSRKK